MISIQNICRMKKNLILLLLLSNVSVYAQENQPVLDPVTVTASIHPDQSSRTGRNIISISGESFSNQPVQSLDELLRYLPGLEVQMRGPMGAQSDIVVRGGTFQQVLVLVDGLRVNDPNTGHFSSYIPIVPSEIERVEVLKGAASAIYGSEAVGGVVHIITKSFANRQQQDKSELSAQVKAGEYDLFHVQVGGYYQHKKTAVSGGILTNNTKGRLQRGTRGFLHNNTASVSVSQLLGNNWQLSVRAAYDNRDFAAQNFYTSFLSDTATEEVQTVWTQARLEYRKDKHRLSIDVGYKSVKDDYLFNSASIANANRSRMLQTTIMDEYRADARTTLTGGVQFINKEIKSNDRGNHGVAQGGAFILLRQQVNDYLVVHPALRFEYNERSGAELVPQLNLSYKKNNWQLRASAGKTIRDADFTERFNNYNKPTVGQGSRMGDPDLKAETSVSYEAGADYILSKYFRVSTSFFQRHQRRLIDYVITSYDDMPRKDNLVPGASYALARNIAKVRTTGVEWDLQLNHDFSTTQHLNAAVGLLWLESSGSESEPSFYVSNHARWLCNFFAEYNWKRLSVGVNGIFKTRKGQEALPIQAELTQQYVVFNMRAGYTFKRKLQVFVQGDNIFDRQYSDLLGAPMPGRWMMGGISWKM